ncbi:hypothetical protein BO71DRAFT_354145, partial [Aspergillus ellipticus CBS 707.79]
MANTAFSEQLSSLDLAMSRTYIRVLLVFENAIPTPQITQRLQCGLQRLSKQVPWIPGRVVPKPTTQDGVSSLEIQWSANNSPTLLDKGTIAISCKCTSSNGMPTEAIPRDVWPVPSVIDDALFTTGAPVFSASIFSFADHGMGLCVCMHHNAVDATGFSEIVRLWSRNIADPLHPEYSKTPPTIPASLPSCTSKLFTISTHWINILKELPQKHTSQAPTTNTVLCALIWTTITRVRMQTNPSLQNKTSRLATAVTGRNRIGTNFSTPRSPFFANTVLYSQSEFPANALSTADETPVHALARICDTIAHSQSHSVIDSRHIAEVCSLIDRVDDYRSLFPGWDLFGSRDVTITSWADLGLYEMDFGGGIGKPGFVRLPCVEADGVVVVLPRKRGAEREGLEVVVMLRRDCMQGLERDGMWRVLGSGG